MKWAYWAGILLLYVVFLAATAPSSTLFWAINQHFGPHTITPENSSGTLWQGEARGIVLAAKGQQALQLGQASWSLNPLRLLSGKLSADIMLTSDTTQGYGKLILGPHNIRLQQVNLSIPAALLAYVEPRLAMWPLQGKLNISSSEFLLQSDNYRGNGEITWEQAGISISKINPIGNYHATFSGTGKAIHIQLQTQSGPLEITGKGNWSQTAGFEFNGKAKAREHGPELRNLLDLIGKPDQDNFYTVKL